MILSELYELIGADYQGVLKRLLKDERIEKYLRKFADGNYFAEITEALDEERWENAFRSVHSMKGMSMNLGLTGLFEVSDILCEELRPCVKPANDITEKVSAVKEEYDKVIEAINRL